MKNTLLAVFIATTIALGVVAVVQWQKLAAQKTEMLAVRADTEQRTREIADLQASQKLSEQQRQELFRQADELAKKLQTREQADAKVAAKNPAGGKSVSGADKPDKEKNPFGDFLAKMMEDPDTRKVIRQQQRAMLDQLYGPLVKKTGPHTGASRPIQGLARRQHYENDREIVLADGRRVRHQSPGDAREAVRGTEGFRRKGKGISGGNRLCAIQGLPADRR
jgi:hypothetical protein